MGTALDSPQVDRPHGGQSLPTPVPQFRLRRSPQRRHAGYTLVEVLITVAIVGLLASMAMGSYIDILFKMKIDRAIWDIRTLEKAIALHSSEHILPLDLSELNISSIIDPWGNPYRYLPIEGASRGQVRKDRFLVPINSDYDLYSMGPDGESRTPLTAKPSRDDIIRAGNGAFVGPADEF